AGARPSSSLRKSTADFDPSTPCGAVCAVLPAASAPPSAAPPVTSRDRRFSVIIPPEKSQRCYPAGAHEDPPRPGGAPPRRIPPGPSPALDGVEGLDRLSPDLSRTHEPRPDWSGVPDDPGTARAREAPRCRRADGDQDGKGRERRT